MSELLWTKGANYNGISICVSHLYWGSRSFELAKLFELREDVRNSACRDGIGLGLRGDFFTQLVHQSAGHLNNWSHIYFHDWLDATVFGVIRTKASNGLRRLKDGWQSMFGHQMCFLVEKA
jgi:hypothetical protein